MSTDDAVGAFGRLLSPIAVRNKQVRNRVVVTAHGASDFFRDPALSPDSYIEYLRRRAAGGAGLIIAQPLLVSAVAPIAESTVERHVRLAEVVKAEGATLLIQLVHLGGYGRTEAMFGRPPSWTFEEHQSDAGESSHRMSEGEIEQLVGAYRSAARVVAEAGFEGVEVHGGHGYLVQQSLTPRTNHRDDRWGADRTLFVRSIIRGVREEIGPGRILCYRTSTDDRISPTDGGRGAEGIAEDLERILGDGAVDLLNTTMGDGGKSYIDSIPGYRRPMAPNMGLIERLRSLVKIDVPVIGVGGIMSPEVAESVLEAGACDMVAMTRAHIADPDVVKKARTGAAHTIRPCVRANVCVDRKQALYPEMGCFHNPEVLRELSLDVHDAQTRKRILVIGGGPAGLKAAEVGARRGHRVDLFESASACGGQLGLTSHTAAAELFNSVVHLESQLRRLGVTIHLGTPVDESVLRDAAPDEVVLAAGARARSGAEALDCGENGVVISSEQALLSELTGPVVVYDATGTTEAALVAEALTARGCNVVLATKFETLMPFAGHMQRWEVPDLLRARLTEIHVGARIGHMEHGVVRLSSTTGGHLADVGADAVVAVVPRLPRRELVPVLEGLGIPYRVVGDVNAPRTAWQAFNEGHLAGLAL